MGSLLEEGWTSFHSHYLLLAQILLQEKRFEQAAWDLTKEGEATVILDNGAYEKKLVDDDDYLRLIDHINPDIVVAPDLVGFTAKKSAQRSLEFYDRLVGDRGYNGSVMLVGQGLNLMDAIDCYNILHEWTYSLSDDDAENIIFGFGQSYLRVLEMGIDLVFEQESPEIREVYTDKMRHLYGEWARRYLISRVYEQVPGIINYPAHMLGARWIPCKDPLPSNFQSFDSYKPTHCALNDKYLPIPSVSQKFIGELKPRRDEDLELPQTDLMLENIARITGLYKKYAPGSSGERSS
jgi:hypothetical protein